MKIVLIIVSLQLAFFANAIGQPFQNITGRIVDSEYQRPLTSANVMILEAGPITGVISDEDGYFSIEEVPVGRYNVLVSYTGY